MELQPLTQSIIAPLLLAIGYSFYLIILFRKKIFDGFSYSGLDGLYSMFANEILLLVFGYIFSR